MSTNDRAAVLEQALRERFGLEQFRPGQREVIEHVVEGRDVLCVMPTGGGKSLCYQLPAVMRPGITLVVSPLIALMKDQVDALLQRGIRATLINSTLDPAEQRARIMDVEAGRYDLVYVAPERFRSGRFVEMMARVKPILLAVDEAHCISEWGHDFRPDYARIGLARKKLGSPPCIALTATATDLVRRDIADQLDLKNPAMFVTGFDRPNLIYAVAEARREADKLAALERVLETTPGSVIVYASSRARCESVAEHVQRGLRRDAVVYHAGMTREERTGSQERFMAGKADVVVATNAFGMGVDKSDIRAVVHYNIPGTLEAYYQEAGRAGRDGLPAQCVLLYAPGDRILQERFIENEYPPPDVVYQVYDVLRKIQADPIELTQNEIKAEAGIDLAESAVGTALKLLEGAGLIERFLPRENMAIVRINVTPEGDDPTAAMSLVGRLGPQAHVQRTVLIGLEGLVNRRYSEPVYFHPDEFAAALGLDRPALSRAIRALTSELPIDYVPPFRGNATRVLDRDRKPRDLGIDFKTLNERKAHEYDKLERMIKYAQSTSCRRSYILGYFGDVRAEAVRCGRCDNCGATGGAAAIGPARVVIDTQAGREVVLKALSGVARAKGRFGKNIVAQMLKGSNSEKMERWRLNELSTFGILSHFALGELTRLLDALAGAGYVECPEVDRFRPIVNLSDAGWAVLKNQTDRPIALDLPPELAAKVRHGGMERVASRPAAAQTPGPAPRPRAEPAADDDSPLAADPLFQTLKALRTEWAREARMPAYCVFTNRTIEALVQDRPTTPQALAAVTGLGQARIERYGAALLEAIRNESAASREEPAADRRTLALFPELAPAEPRPPAPDVPASPSRATTARTSDSAHVPTEEWTWRLIDRGFDLAAAAAIRGLERTAIVRHLTLVARQGKPIAPEVFLDPETLRRWNAWRAEHGDTALPPDHSVPDELWSLFLACRRSH